MKKKKLEFHEKDPDLHQNEMDPLISTVYIYTRAQQSTHQSSRV